MDVSVAGFDWDAGNRAKCKKHGVSVVEVEGLFSRPLFIIPDASHSQSEERLRAIGKTASGRSVFRYSRFVCVPANGLSGRLARVICTERK